MTIPNNDTTHVTQEDELVVIRLLNEMVLAERWDLTNLGRDYLREAKAEDTEILERLQSRDERRVSNILQNR